MGKTNKQKLKGKEDYTVIQSALATWIDTTVLATLILEILKENKLPVTYENARNVWLKECELLSESLQSVVNTMFNKED